MTHTDWDVAKTKLNALRELCIEDDLLDLQAFDSIERANKIQRAWDALDVIKNIDKLLADARKEVIKRIEAMPDKDVRPQITVWLESKEYCLGYNKALSNVLATLREEEGSNEHTV